MSRPLIQQRNLLVQASCTVFATTFSKTLLVHAIIMMYTTRIIDTPSYLPCVVLLQLQLTAISGYCERQSACYVHSALTPLAASRGIIYLLHSAVGKL